MLTVEEQTHFAQLNSAKEGHRTEPDESVTLLTDITQAKIAIVDDEPINIEAVQHQLGEGGFQRFLSTTDSEQEISLFRESCPDLVLLDISMPGVGGLDILRVMKNDVDLKYIPVIFLTASATTEMKHEALDLRACDFLPKPVDINNLLPRVRRIKQ